MSTSPFCGQCGHPNNLQAPFCAKCGARLQPPAMVQPRPIRTTSALTKKQWILIGVGVAIFAALFVTFGVTEELRKKREAQKEPGKLTASSSVAPTPTPPAPADALAQAKQLASGTKEQQAEAVKLLQSIPKDVKEYKEAQALLKKTTDSLAKILAEEAVLGPKPEQSPLNGTVYVVDKYLEKVLNDYSSSEYVEWSPVTKVTIKNEPYWVVRLKLRAKNAFGAYILKDVYFFIRQNQVVKVENL